MPRHDDYFRSHMFEGDPRTPLTAAGACIWPTIPAHRYAFTSTDAYGVLAPLNTTPILIEKVTPGSAHDLCQWNMIAGPPPVLFCIVWKRVDEDRLGYTWEIGLSSTACGIMEKEIHVERGRCNEGFSIGEMTCPDYHGGTGDTFAAEQVVFDEVLPPVYP